MATSPPHPQLSPIMSTKTFQPCSTQIVSYGSPLSFAEVRSRFERHIHKPTPESLPPTLADLRQATTTAEITHVVENLTKGGNFLYFTDYIHHTWLSTLTGEPSPAIVAYTFGNPLIARHIFERDSLGALFIPPRILLREAPDLKGTVISYHVPSSLIPDASKAADQRLNEVLLDLDDKVEQLVADVLGE